MNELLFFLQGPSARAGPAAVCGHPVCGPPLGHAPGPSSCSWKPLGRRARCPSCPSLLLPVCVSPLHRARQTPSPLFQSWPRAARAPEVSPRFPPLGTGGGTPPCVAEAGCRPDARACCVTAATPLPSLGLASPIGTSSLASSHSRFSQGFCPPVLPRWLWVPAGGARGGRVRTSLLWWMRGRTGRAPPPSQNHLQAEASLSQAGG